jgi:hypothetical protein
MKANLQDRDGQPSVTPREGEIGKIMKKKLLLLFRGFVYYFAIAMSKANGAQSNRVR